MLRVSMLSKWHVHASDYARELMALKHARITAVWDEDIHRGMGWAEELNVPFEASLEQLLMRDDVDGVVVCCPTNMHKDVMVAAANAGKHIFTEKVMAPTLKECYEIANAVEKAGVKFCISFPQRTLPVHLFAKKVVDDQLLGDVTLLRVRRSHDGAIAGWLPNHFFDPVQCGGGAMIDLGTHPMYLARWILGKPLRISALFNHYTGKSVEDNAVCVMEFENKAIAIAETGFVAARTPDSLEINGTEGSLVIGGPDNKIQLKSNKIQSDIPGWITPQKLPDKLPSALEQWIHAIKGTGDIHFGPEEGIQLTELIQGAYLSHREKRMVEFSELKIR